MPATEAVSKALLAVGVDPKSAEVSLVWLPVDSRRMILCWRAIVVNQSGHLFQVLIDAQNGEVLLRHSWTFGLSNATYRVFGKNSPTPFSPGHSTPNSTPPPLEGTPPNYSRVSVTLDAGSTNASPYGWISDGETRTIGNNADARLNLTNSLLVYNAAVSPPRPNRADRVFDYPLNLTQSPDTADNQNAAVVNAFYWVNWMHDELYDLGFTETLGNFQLNNGLKGGYGNDPVLLDIHVGSQLSPPTLNGGFTQVDPVDQHQVAPRIQLTLYGRQSGEPPGGPAPFRDSALDTEVILHEYTHLMTQRVVGHGAGLSAEQTLGLNEGWSDFFALSLLSEAVDDEDLCYPFGAYSTYLWYKNSQVSTENYYFGMRRYPYTTDMSKNPLTLKDANPALCRDHRPIPINPIDAQVDEVWDIFYPTQADDPWHQGELWATILWEARANLIKRLGFPGNERMVQLVFNGMNLGPANPGFINGRNAILTAANNIQPNPGSDVKDLWAAFYKRGLGASAVDKNPGQGSELLEAFNRADFNLDGKSDIILEDTTTSVKVWTMNGAAQLGETWLIPSSLGGSWLVAGTGDINRDGKVDLFLQDSGLNVAYRCLNETSVVSQGALDPPHPGDSWRIVGTGDFNGDTKQDLLWQYTSGYLVVWYMNGPTLISAAWLSPYDPGDYRWKVVGTGDFDRDGKVDILFQYFNPGGGYDGMLAVWYMDGVNLLSATALNPMYPSGPEWRVAGTEDYNSDGNVDILFQLKLSPNGGDLGIWFMNGVNLTNATLTTPTNPGTNWNVVGPR